LRLRRCLLLHVTVAADESRHRSESGRRFDPATCEAGFDQAEIDLILLHQATLQAAFGAVAEDVECRAAEALETGQQRKCRHHPRSEARFAQIAVRVSPSEDRGREVEFQTSVTLELGG